MGSEESGPFSTFICEDGRCFYMPRMDLGRHAIELPESVVHRMLRDQDPSAEPLKYSVKGAHHVAALRTRRFVRLHRHETAVHIFCEGDQR